MAQANSNFDRQSCWERGSGRGLGSDESGLRRNRDGDEDEFGIEVFGDLAVVTVDDLEALVLQLTEQSRVSAWVLQAARRSKRSVPGLRWR